jgi:chorismate mutase
MIRGVRGAITVADDRRDVVLEAVARLLREMLDRNGFDQGDIISAVFTATDDLRSVFPAEAARLEGMSDVPLLCARELAVDGSLPRCIRILLHVHSDLARSDVEHVYLDGARALRDDLG